MKNYNHCLYELILNIKGNKIRTIVGVSKMNGNSKLKFNYDVYIQKEGGIIDFNGDNFSYRLTFSSGEEFSEKDLVKRITTHFDKKPL